MLRRADIDRPDEDDYFVLKAKHSGFYHSQLDLLIDYLQVRTIVLAGFATDICVLFTASDAYMRDLDMIVPPDCSAAVSMEDHEKALEHMSRVLKVKLTPSGEINFMELANEWLASPQHATTSGE
jgi:nicotinamidase-related amidase